MNICIIYTIWIIEIFIVKTKLTFINSSKLYNFLIRLDLLLYLKTILKTLSPTS